MTKKRLLREYKRSIKSIRALTDSVGISDNEFDSLFNDCLSSVENNERHVKTKRNKNVIYWFIWSLIIIGVSLYVVNYLLNGKPFSFIFCKIQELIYPGLRLLRIISIPIISYFPSLTGKTINNSFCKYIKLESRKITKLISIISYRIVR